MDNLAGTLGYLLGFIFLSIPALASLASAVKAKKRSQRLADFALVCGFSALVLPELLILKTTDYSPTLLLGSALVRALIAAAGIIFAVLAFVFRKDGGVGVGRPLAGGLICLVHLGIASVLLVFGSMGGGTPWIYQSPDGLYQLTLPSQHWQHVPGKEGPDVVNFARNRPPQMHASVRVKRQQTQRDYSSAVERFKAQFANNVQQLGNPQFREGTGQAGRTYMYFTAVETSKEGKTVFVATAIWWCPDKKTLLFLIVESLPVMASQMGQAAEKDTFVKDAETICLSVQ